MKVRNLWKRQLLITFCLFAICFGTGCGQKEEAFQEVTLQETEQSLNETEKNKETEEIHDAPKTTSVCVYVCGAVNNTGVYELKKDARIYEAIECAGGLREDAALSAVNQAEYVSDGQQIYIPTQEEYNAGGFSEMVVSSSADSSDGKVHLNTATKDELKTLSGIGESRAESILAYRESHGAFQSVEELMNVEGIKEGIYQKIKDQIAL